MSTAEGGGNIVTDGLVLCLDAANSKSIISGSTTWNDLSRGGNNGTLVNGPTFNSGSGGGIIFDRTDDYVSILDNTILRPTIFTLDAWIKPTSFAQFNTVITKPYNGPSWSNPYLSYMIRIDYNGTQLECSTNNGTYSYLLVNYTFSINTVYNITFTYDSTTRVAIAYLNGNQIGSTTFSPGNILYSAFPVLVGSSGGYVSTGGIGSEGFSGTIYNVKTYNKALSSQEVLQNYNATKTRFGL